VYAKGRKIDVQSAEQFLRLDRSVLGALKIGVYIRTPAVDWLNKHRLVEQAVPFRLLNADPGHYPGKIIEEDLAAGKIDAAVVWGPIGGFFAKRVTAAELVVLPLKSEPGVRFDFSVAMGVRHGEQAWRDRIQATLDDSREDIAGILREYNIPVVDENGEPIR
jgi:ABC-type amino acid transport substrate-binding protein